MVAHGAATLEFRYPDIDHKLNDAILKTLINLNLNRYSIHKRTCDLRASKNHAKPLYDLQLFHMNILNTSEYLFQGINSGQIQVSGPTPTCWADWAPGLGETFGGRKESQVQRRSKFFFLTGCLRAMWKTQGQDVQAQGPSGFSWGNWTLDGLTGLIIFTEMNCGCFPKLRARLNGWLQTYKL